MKDIALGIFVISGAIGYLHGIAYGALFFGVGCILFGISRAILGKDNE